MQPKLLTLALLLASQAVFANSIYSYTDENGQRVFTDQPPTQQPSTQIKPQPINRLPATQTTRKVRPQSKPPKTQKAQVYSLLQINTPVHDSTFLANDRSFSINVSSTPALLAGHSFQVWLDGEPHGPSSETHTWQVTDIDRGSHSLQVNIINADGDVLASSAPIKFHLRQTTLADRRRIRPCTLDDYGKRLECPLKDKPEPKRRWWRLGF